MPARPEPPSSVALTLSAVSLELDTVTWTASPLCSSVTLGRSHRAHRRSTLPPPGGSGRPPASPSKADHTLHAWSGDIDAHGLPGSGRYKDGKSVSADGGKTIVDAHINLGRVGAGYSGSGDDSYRPRRLATPTNARSADRPGSGLPSHPSAWSHGLDVSHPSRLQTRSGWCPYASPA
jgi:hypothetical protein